MICRRCREGDHEDCRGHSWCDCQHGTPHSHPARDDWTFPSQQDAWNDGYTTAMGDSAKIDGMIDEQE